MQYVFADVDGFTGKTTGTPQKTVLIPREAGFYRVTVQGEGGDAKSDDLALENRRPVTDAHLEGLYFRGGLDEDFLAVNQRSLEYQRKKIHGFSLDGYFNAPAGLQIVELPPDSTQAAIRAREFLIEHAVAVARQARQTQHQRLPRTVFVHKGGPEGDWLAEAARKLGGEDIATVLDLNRFACPKASKLLSLPEERERVSKRSRCTARVHRGAVDKNWMAHCPQTECLVLARWAAEHLEWRDAKPERRDALTLEDAITLVSSRLSSACSPEFSPPSVPGSKPRRRRVNWARAQLSRENEYLPDGLLSALVEQLEI